jgi:hypothetical protein
MKAAIAAVIALAAALGIAQNAEAKTPAYVITGGELGPYAYHFFLGPEDEDNFGDASIGLEAPKPLPALAYDLYNSWGNFAVPFQIANGGPELRYYPEPKLLSRPADGVWMKVSEGGAAVLDGAIEEAAAKKAKGELEGSPIAADFRARHLAVASYGLYAYPAAGLDSEAIDPWLRSRRLGGIGPPESERLIMKELVTTVTNAPVGSQEAAPELVISYSARVGDTGYGGFLGFYSSPNAGRPGHFWDDGYSNESSWPYYETSPGFDTMIAEAMAEAQSARPVEEDAGGGMTTAEATGVAAIGAGVVGAALATGVFLRRRRRPLSG